MFHRPMLALASALAVSACLEADATMQIHGEDRVDLSVDLFIGMMGNVMTSEDCSPLAEPHLTAEPLGEDKCRLFGSFSLEQLPSVLADYSGEFGNHLELSRVGEFYRLEVEVERGFIMEAPDDFSRSLVSLMAGDGYAQLVLTASNIVSTSGEISNGNQTATVRVDLMELSEPGNETITHFIEFESQERPFWQRWFD